MFKLIRRVKNKIELQLSLRLRFTFIFLLSFLSSSLVVAAPDFPPPPNASVEWVGKNIQVNGIKSQVRRFDSNKSIEKVVEFYRKEWKRPVAKDMPGFTETIASAPWYIISRIEDDTLLTVQVQVKEDDNSASWGYLSMSPLPSKIDPGDIGKGTPKMSTSQVMSEIKSDDPGKKATTTIISNDHSVSSNVNFYRNYFQSEGWTSETDRELDQGKNHALVYKTRRNRVTMMFMKDRNSTKIVINNVTHSILR
jgi:hypothetical protein